MCVQVTHHTNVGSTIDRFQKNGWNLNTYSTAQIRPNEINHYLLFEKGPEKKVPSSVKAAAAAAAAAAT